MPRYQHLVALVCFSLVALVLTGPALVGRSALGPDSILDWDPLLRTQPVPPLPRAIDCTPILLHFPKDLSIAHGLRAGRVDLWNPLAGCGMPLWAEQSGPFFPLKLPFYVAPSRQSYDLFLALRLVAAALGAYALARYRGLRLTPAIASGASFELSGAMIAQLPFGVASPVYVLPWVVLGSYAIAARRSATAVVGAGVALGIAGNGGHPTLVLLVFAAFAAAVAGHVASARRSPRAMLGIAACGALAALLGMALAAPSLLPLAELADLASSYKSRPVGARIWLQDLAQSRATLPIVLFAPGTIRALLPESWMPLAYAPAIGALGFVAAVAGMVRGRFDAALVSVAALGLALATVPPGVAWLHDLPGLHLILPTYAWPLVVLALGQAVGRGVEISTTPRGRTAGWLAIVVLAGGALALYLLSWTNVSPVGTALGDAARGASGLLRLALPVVFAAAALGVCAVLGRTRRVALCPAFLTVLMVGEQMLTMAPLVRQQPSVVLSSPPSPAVQFLQRHLADGNGRLLAVPHRVGFPLSPMLFGLADLRAMSALPVRRYYDYLRAISPAAGPHTTQEVPVIRSPLLDLAAVRYVVLARPNPPAAGKPTHEEIAAALLFASPHIPAADDPTMPMVYDDERVRIYENRSAVPRVRIVHDAIATSDQRTATQWLALAGTQIGGAGDLGMDTTVIVEPDEHGTQPPALSGGAPAREAARIVDASQPDRLVIEAHLQSPGLVVVADTYYPGWKAKVDGTATSIFPANLLFRAVFVPGGTHTIVLTYAPRSFMAGVVICLVAALGAVWIVMRRSVIRDS